MTVPKGHEEIGIESLGNLSIKDGALYWKGQRLTTEVEVRLSWLQGLVAGLLSLIVAIAAIASPIIAYLADQDNICRNTNNRAWLCPEAEKPQAPNDKSQQPVDQSSDNAG